MGIFDFFFFDEITQNKEVVLTFAHQKASGVFDVVNEENLVCVIEQEEVAADDVVEVVFGYGLVRSDVLTKHDAEFDFVVDIFWAIGFTNVIVIWIILAF